MPRLPLNRIAAPLCLLASLAGLASCGVSQRTPAEPATPPRTSAVYVLTPGATVALAPNASIKLERVNDSRCRTGAVCVWHGYISYSFVLRTKAGSTPFVLAEQMPGAANSATQQGLRFTLDGMEPAEPPAINTAVPDYRVSLKVELTQAT